MSWEDRDYANFDPTRRADGFGGLDRGTGGRFADNPLSWSPTIGRIFGIRVRVHITLILFMFFELFRFGFSIWTVIFEAVLFGSVLLHEFGHCFAARSVGGSANDILMWPLGGLASVDAPRRPGAQFITVICGPLVNVVLIVVATAAIYLMGGHVAMMRPYPFFAAIPSLALSGSYVFEFLNAALYANAALFIFNLLPMFPMDGGRMLHCALWKSIGHYKGSMITCTVGMVIAVAVGLFAIASRQYMLLAIAFLGYLASMQERQLVRAGASTEDGYMGYDFSGGYTTLGGGEAKRAKQPGLFAKWKQKRTQGKWRAQREKDAAELQQVDAILDKVKRDGIASLTSREKKLLEEATRKQQAQDRRAGL